MARRDGEAGFTLLELLVVMTLCALVLVIVTQGLQYAGRVRSRLHMAAERHDEVIGVQRLIVRLIAGALPTFQSSLYSDRTLAFEGLPDAMTVVGWLPDSLGQGMAGVQRLYVSSDASGTSLFLSWRLDLPPSSNELAPAEQRLRLLSGVQRFSILYYGRDSRALTASWHTTWVNETHLPDEVRIELACNGGTAVLIPPIYAAPVATAVPSCRFDPENVECLRVQ